MSDTLKVLTFLLMLVFGFVVGYQIGTPPLNAGIAVGLYHGLLFVFCLLVAEVLAWFIGKVWK